MMKLLIIGLICLQSDWTQWGGKYRNFTVNAQISGINTQKPLTKIWQQPVGEGYSGLIVAGGKVVSQSRDGNAETVIACDVETGKEIWRHRYQAPAIESMIPRYGFGPHSTACVSGEYVCSIGGTGIVHVLNLETGKVVWSKSIWNEYEATKVERGYSSSPIVHDGKLILPVGGSGSGVVAFDLETGDEVWKSTDCNACYASPVIAKFHDKTQLICLMDQMLLAIEPGSGKLLWSYDYPTFKTVHVTSPLVLPFNRLFFLSSNKAKMLRVNYDKQKKKFSLVTLWESRSMTPQVGNVIDVGDQLVGPHTTMNATLTGISQQRGERLWRSRISNAGFLYKFNDGFVSINDRGVVSFNQMVKGDPFSIAKADLKLKGRIWNTAAFTENKMFVRDQDTVYAYKFERDK